MAHSLEGNYEDCVSMSCPYKNLFGAEGTGAHSYRFMGLAVVDAGGPHGSFRGAFELLSGGLC